MPSPPTAAASAQQHPSGSLTARPHLHRSPSLSNAGSLRAPLSAREAPAEAAARRAALHKSVAAAAGGGGSRLLAGAAASSRRAAAGSSEMGTSGALNSARGVRSSFNGTASRRWN
jgi:hypothetical protein